MLTLAVKVHIAEHVPSIGVFCGAGYSYDVDLYRTITLIAPRSPRNAFLQGFGRMLATLTTSER